MSRKTVPPMWPWRAPASRCSWNTSPWPFPKCGGPCGRNSGPGRPHIFSTRHVAPCSISWTWACCAGLVYFVRHACVVSEADPAIMDVLHGSGDGIWTSHENTGYCSTMPSMKRSQSIQTQQSQQSPISRGRSIHLPMSIPQTWTVCVNLLRDPIAGYPRPIVIISRTLTRTHPCK